MLREITIGQYYQAESVIHRLDPRTKITATFFYIISLFLFNSVAVYALAFLLLVSVIALSRVPVSFIFRGMKSIAFLLMITVVFNLFLTPGEPLITLWRFTLTDQGLIIACFTAARLVFLIVGSSLLTLTTTPNNLTDGLERLMYPLRYVRMPVHEVAMMMSIALRFIPILLDETDKIMKAQLSRGADFEHGNLVKRTKNLIPILVPLFVSAFRRANDLALAMEARCYRGGDGRTKMKPLRYHSRDGAAYALMVLYLVGIILLGRFSPV